MTREITAPPTLRELRARKGLSQDEMAFKLEMSGQNYRNYEAGRYMTMSQEMEKQISEILGEVYRYVR